MALSTHPTQRITPVPGADGLRTRRRQATGHIDDTPAPEEAPVTKAIALHADPKPRRQNEPVRPHVPGTLAAQLIAQKLPGKSERRLARHFPDRVHRAYLQAACTVPTTRTLHSA